MFQLFSILNLLLLSILDVAEGLIIVAWVQLLVVVDELIAQSVNIAIEATLAFR